MVLSSFRTSADGNCLFNSCSVMLCHTETLCTLLRMLTSLELYKNASYYSQHKLFHEVHNNSNFLTYNSVFFASLSNNVISNELSNDDYVRKTAMEIVECGIYVPFIAVIALSNVIHVPIHLFTKELKDMRLMDLYNITINPESKVAIDPLYLFWASLGNPVSDKLDHFVPLFHPKMFSSNVNDDNKDENSNKPFDFKVLSDIFSSIGMKRKRTILSNIESSKKRLKIPTAVTPLFKNLPTDGVSEQNKINIKSNLGVVKTGRSGPSDIRLFCKSIPKTLPASLIPSPSSVIPESISKNSILVDANMKNSYSSEDTTLSATPLESALPKVMYTSTLSQNDQPSSSVVLSSITSIDESPGSIDGSLQPFTDLNDINNFVCKVLTTEEKIDIIQNVWKPHDSYNFPKNGKGKKFQYKWFVSFAWLAYSANVDGAFCMYCVLFGATTGEHNASKLSQLFTTPYTNWNNAIANFTRHQTKSPVHLLAVPKFTSFRKIYINKKSVPVNVQMNEKDRTQIEENREKLRIILRAVLFCAKQNVALRAHRDDSKHYQLDGNNPGNFQELLHLICVTGNSLLENHLKNAPRNATYRSKTVQNELIQLSAQQLQKSIIKSVIDAKIYSIMADEASDISCKEQLSLVIRFVDTNSEIREEFLGFLHCGEGTSGEAISALILKELKRLGLDVMNCRAQAYDGAGNMSGKYNGCAARIMQVNKLAIYCHCQSHSLSLCVCYACKMPVVVNMMNKIRCVEEFFSNSPKRTDLLCSMIDLHITGSQKTKLKNCCRTRWVEKVDSFQIFSSLYPAILSSLSSVSENVGGHWNNDSVYLASSLLSGITTFEFLITLEVVKGFTVYLRSLTIRLQERRADISKTLKHVSTVKAVLEGERENIDQKQNNFYSAVCNVAKEHNISIEKPRTCVNQGYRENYPSENISEYYKRSLTIPFLESLLVQMEQRFTPKNLALYSGFNLLPSIMIRTPSWKSMLQPFLDVYQSTITDFADIAGELDLWQKYWEGEFKTPSALLEQQCASIAEVLKKCEVDDLKTTFPMIYECLRILGTVPVTTCECERSISVLRRLKSYLRSTMSQDRFTSLALLHIRREYEHNLDVIINRFAARHPRRMKLIDILNDDPEEVDEINLLTDEDVLNEDPFEDINTQ